MTTIICMIINCMNVCSEVQYNADGTYKIISQKVIGTEKNCQKQQESNLPELPQIPALPN